MSASAIARKKSASETRASDAKSAAAEENRNLRTAYRGLLTSLDDSKAEALRPDSTILIDNLLSANKLFEHVTRAQESALDAKVLLATADLSAFKAQRLKLASGSFQIEVFVSKLRHKLSRFGDQEDAQPMDVNAEEVYGQGEDGNARIKWSNLHDAVNRAFISAPSLGFMLGPLQIVPKVRVPKVRQEKIVKEALVKPQELKEADMNAQGGNETVRNVNELFKILEDIEEQDGEALGWPLFDFFINPFSFSQSVENLFHLSFLIRDGKVQIQENDEGDLIIATCEAPVEADFQSGDAEYHQNIFHFDMDTWRRIIDLYDIRESTIPHRERKTDNVGSSKWYG